MSRVFIARSFYYQTHNQGLRFICTILIYLNERRCKYPKGEFILPYSEKNTLGLQLDTVSNKKKEEEKNQVQQVAKEISLESPELGWHNEIQRKNYDVFAITDNQEKQINGFQNNTKQ